ncbi:hypothetical protein CKO36_15000 [Rhabdochromatium marinum]|nr:hypothetical protein [Rhabdochromatium marinum]
MNNIKNPLRYIASDVEFNVFLEIITDCGLFKQYLDAKKIKLWGRDRKFALAQNPEIGLLTFYFLYMCFNNNQMAILSPCKVFQLYPSQFSLDAVLRFESLERDFPALMSEWNIPVLPLEQLNASKHDEWSRYYTKETKNIVLKKDWLIFKLFYPEFLKSCGLYSW